MLFNSYPFLLVFLPAVIAAFLLAARGGNQVRLVVLLAASLLFYAWWDVRFLALLAASVLINYQLSNWLTRAMERDDQGRAGHLLTAGVVFNLAMLALFKYANFFVTNVNAVAGTEWHLAAIVLPLGISFFTFEQIGYLVDIRRGHLYRADLLRYSVFVSFFPRLVAGPILRYSEIGPQLDFSARKESRTNDVAVGLTIFAFGLFKKVVLADGIAPYASAAFTSASTGPLDMIQAWGGILAYTFQLYFDFSGYSDMAIGAARCFGIVFPMNFNSPYKSASIIEFWRRWHITLSRFLRDYLYISLGGNRQGPARRHANLLATMLLGGLWHGANWTFVIWGALHGCYLIINHGWRTIAARSPALARLQGTRFGHVLAVAITFIAVMVAWVFFRAPDINTAFSILGGMVGAHGIVIPDGLAAIFRDQADLLARFGITFGDASTTQMAKMYAWVIALFAVSMFAPNTQEILARFTPTLEACPEQAPTHRRFAWNLAPRYAVAAGAITFIALIAITRVSEFLYWQF